MALVVPKAGVHLDDTNGCYRVESANLGLANTTYQDMSTARATLPFTFSNAGTLEGAMFSIRSGANTNDRSVAFSLQSTKGTVTLTIASPGVVNLTGHGFVGGETISFATTGALPTGLTAGVKYFVKYKDANSFNVAATSGGANINFTGTQSGTQTLWLNVETKTLTSAQICPSTEKFAQVNVPVTGWSSAIDTVASKWRFLLATTGGTIGSWYAIGVTATEPMHAAWSSTLTTWTSGDQVIWDAYGTVLVNKSYTFNGAFFSSQVDNGVAGFICRAANPSLLAATPRISQADLSAPITLNFAGHLFIGSFSQWILGSSTDRIPATKKVTINFNDPTVGTASPAMLSFSSSDAGRSQIINYGEKPTNVTATLAADALTGQAVITTVEDVTALGWQVGNEISVGKQDTIGSGELSTKIIQSITGGGKIITLTTNLLTANRKAGGQVINLSRPVGIEYASTRTNGTSCSLYNPSALIFDGCKINSVLFSTSATLAYNYAEDVNNLKGIQLNDCLLTSTTTSLVSIISSSIISPLGNSATNCYCHRVVPFANYFAFYNTYFKSGSMTLNTVLSNNPYTSGNLTPGSGSSLPYVSAKNIKCYNMTVTAASTAAGITLYGQNCIYENIYVWGNGGTGAGGVSFATLVNPISIKNIQVEKSTYGAFIQAGTTVNVNCSDFRFGQETANTTDFYTLAGSVINIAIDKPQGVANFDESNMPFTSPGSEIKFTNFNLTSGDTRSYTTFGKLFAGPNPTYQKHTGYTFDATDPLTVPYYADTATVTGASLYASMNVKIENAAYYAGTYTLPTLSLYADGDFATPKATNVATATTSQQTLAASYVFTTDNNQVNVSLTQKTDASEANSGVTVDTLLLNLRKYGSIFQNNTIAIPQTRPYPITVAKFSSLAVNPFITQTSAATVAAYTGISINGATNTVTITSTHSMKELYDYSQWWATQNPSYPEPITTSDGNNFNSSFNLTINNCALTGTGNENLGTNTLTLIGTGTSSVNITYPAGTQTNLVISNLIAGSTVQVYSTGDSVELFNGVAGSAILVVPYLWSTDRTVRLRIRKADYQHIETNITLISSGYAYVANQAVDSVYVANAIDGSTVSEVSLVGSTVTIDIDDSDNTTTGARIYAGYKYLICTTAFIGLQPADFNAQTTHDYTATIPLTVKNMKPETLTITGANIVDNLGGSSWIDLTGGNINVVSYYASSNMARDVRIEMDSNSSKLKYIAGEV